MRLIFLLLSCVLLALADDAPFLEHWMELLMDSYKHTNGDNLTLFDLSIPGTHDTLTYDLGSTVSRIEEAQQTISKILSVVCLVPVSPLCLAVKGVLNNELVKQARTQKLDITAQLNSGIRFFDLRASWEPGSGSDTSQWYGVHFVLTKHPFTNYLVELNNWLTSHPKEMVVLWISYHGDKCAQNQFAASPGAYEWLSSQITTIFGNKLVDPLLGKPNATTYSTYQQHGAQVLLYMSALPLFQTKAFDPCLGLWNPSFPNANLGVQSFYSGLSDYLNINNTKQLKQQGVFSLVSRASSSGPPLLTDAIVLDLAPETVGVKIFLHECREQFNIPQAYRTRLDCPRTLYELSQFTNYYNQRSFDYAVRKGLLVPNAVYIDAVMEGGKIDTGVGNGFAYVGALLRTSTGHMTCSNPNGCSEFQKSVDGLLRAGPYQQTDDNSRGLLPDWPPLPGSYPSCLLGYVPFKNSCYLKPYEAYLGDMCGDAAHCSAPPEGMCSDGWGSTAHGNCALKCYDDCVVDISDNILSQIQNGEAPPFILHNITDPKKYFVCGTDSSDWISLPDAKNIPADQLIFNNGRSAGSRDNYQCSLCGDGYEMGTDSNCYLKAYQSNKKCCGNLHCSAPDDLCSVGWVGSCNGNCLPWGGCYNNCVADFSDKVRNQIQNQGVSKYYVCNLNGQWVEWNVAAASDHADYAFNTGKGAGHRNDFNCQPRT